MVDGFTTTYAIGAISPLMLWVRLGDRSGRGVQHYVIQFVRDLRQVGGFSGSSTNKTDRHDILVTEILWNVTLSTIKPNQILSCR